MTVKEAKEILSNIQKRQTDEEFKNRIGGIISDLPKLFGDLDEVSDSIAEQITYGSSSLGVDYAWAMRLHNSIMQMKRYMDCKKQLKNNNGIIDGETAQWWTTIVQGVLGVVSVIFVILFALGIIPNVFGELGENKNTDALYYVIGTVGQQTVALVLAIIIGLVNKHRIKKKYSEAEITFEELLAVKYEKKPIKLELLFHGATYIQNIAPGGSGFQGCTFIGL